MLFNYACEACGERLDKDFRIGKAPKTVACSCGKRAKRVYESMSFVLKGGNWPGKFRKFNAEMTERNEKAGRRMRKEHTPPVNLAAYDYGDGDVRGVG